MKKIVLLLAKIIFSLGIIVVLLLKIDLDQLYRTIINMEYWYFLLSFLISLLCLYLATLRWQILLKEFTIAIPFVELFRFICLSFFYNFFIPGGFAGDIIRGYKCKKYYISSTYGIASVFIDRLIGLASFILFGIFGILFTLDVLKQTKLFTPFIIVLAISLFLLFILFNRKIISCFKVLSNIHSILYNKLKQLYNCIYFYKGYKSILVTALIVSLFASFFNILVFYLLSVSTGGVVTFINFIFFIPIITIISYLPISYSGLGIREAGFVLLFSQIGMSREQALAIPLMYFGLLFLLAIVGGMIYIFTINLNVAKVEGATDSRRQG